MDVLNPTISDRRRTVLTRTSAPTERVLGDSRPRALFRAWTISGRTTIDRGRGFGARQIGEIAAQTREPVLAAHLMVGAAPIVVRPGGKLWTNPRLRVGVRREAPLQLLLDRRNGVIDPAVAKVGGRLGASNSARVVIRTWGAPQQHTLAVYHTTISVGGGGVGHATVPQATASPSYRPVSAAQSFADVIVHAAGSPRQHAPSGGGHWFGLHGTPSPRYT